MLVYYISIVVHSSLISLPCTINVRFPSMSSKCSGHIIRQKSLEYSSNQFWSNYPYGVLFCQNRQFSGEDDVPEWLRMIKKLTRVSDVFRQTNEPIVNMLRLHNAHHYGTTTSLHGGLLQIGFYSLMCSSLYRTLH